MANAKFAMVQLSAFIPSVSWMLIVRGIKLVSRNAVEILASVHAVSILYVRLPIIAPFAPVHVDSMAIHRFNASSLRFRDQKLNARKILNAPTIRRAGIRDVWILAVLTRADLIAGVMYSCIALFASVMMGTLEIHNSTAENVSNQNSAKIEILRKFKDEF